MDTGKRFSIELNCCDCFKLILVTFLFQSRDLLGQLNHFVLVMKEHQIKTLNEYKESLSESITAHVKVVLD